MRIALLLALVVVVTGCGAAGRTNARPTTGAIAGLARDHDSGDPVSLAEVRIVAVRSQARGTPHVTTTRENGLYDVDRLAPGTYDLVAVFAGQPVKITNITVRAGIVTMVDILFTLGRPDPITVDFGNSQASQIDRYRPRNLSTGVGIIEGTVTDTETRERVVGAVVTAITTGAETQQTISDDRGRFRFDGVRPGVYSVSAYYSVGGRGQIEVLRNGIDVGGSEAVVVPLFIEMTK